MFFVASHAGTIHVLGATMVGWDAPLKIFSGMGRVQSHVHRNFSRDEPLGTAR